MRDAGYDVSAAPSGKAWTLTIAGSVFYFGAIPVGFMALDQESIGLMLGSLAMWVTGGLLAAWALDTDEKWRLTLESARKTPGKPLSSVRIAPAITTTRDLDGMRRFSFGIGGVF
jgi:hypothetical protein